MFYQIYSGNHVAISKRQLSNTNADAKTAVKAPKSNSVPPILRTHSAIYENLNNAALHGMMSIVGKADDFLSSSHPVKHEFGY